MKVIVSASVPEGCDRRYVVVDERAGEVPGGAQGYGDKTAQNAHRPCCCKSAPPNKARRDAAGRDAGRWCAAHKALVSDAGQAMLSAVKGGDWFTTAAVGQLLAGHGVELPLPVPGLMGYWWPW